MVKSGEAFSTVSNKEDKDGFILDVDERPRSIWAPSDEGCGFLQAMQSSFFDWIKKHLPSFIHG
jgi:hypothetical protein